MAHYEALGLTTQAGTDEIKKAYHKLALRYHPDKNKSPEAPARFRDIAAAWQVLSDPERKLRYDRSGGEDEGVASKDREDVDPHGVFREAFEGYTAQEAFEEEFLARIKRKLWRDRRVAVSSHILKVTDNSVRVCCASRRLSWYPLGGLSSLLVGSCLALWPGEPSRWSLFRDNSERRLMGGLLSVVGFGIAIIGSQRPVLHVDMRTGTFFTGNLYLWHRNKQPSKAKAPETAWKRVLQDLSPRGRLWPSFQANRQIQVPVTLLCLCNWLDYSNAMEQWKQYSSIVGLWITLMVPVVDAVERKSVKWGKGIPGLSGLLQAVGYSAVYVLTQKGSFYLRSLLVDGNEPVPNVECYMGRRPHPYLPVLPPQCKASGFTEFSRRT